MEEIWVSSFHHTEKYYSASLWSPGPPPAADLLQRSQTWSWQMPIHCRGSFPGVILLGTSQRGSRLAQFHGIQEVGWESRTILLRLGRQGSSSAAVGSCRQLLTSWAEMDRTRMVPQSPCGRVLWELVALGIFAFSPKNLVRPHTPACTAPSAPLAATQPSCGHQQGLSMHWGRRE